MEKIVNNNAIDVGDTVFLIFKRCIQSSRKERLIYNTHDALKVLSFFNKTPDDKNAILAHSCEVEDAHGNVFEVELNQLSLKPDDKDKRAGYYRVVTFLVLLAVTFLSVILTLISIQI